MEAGVRSRAACLLFLGPRREPSGTAPLPHSSQRELTLPGSELCPTYRILPCVALVLISLSGHVSVQKKQEQKAPDRDAIVRATASLPSCNMDRAVVQTSMRDVSAAEATPPVTTARAGGRLSSLWGRSLAVLTRVGEAG